MTTTTTAATITADIITKLVNK